ncbi:Clan IH, family I25, phytocystatin-like peptidase inhibitor [Histomonas meleagridis]|uniref:Clan IH, family I25, phytocystatin-like peptidase inhibitor n=1 Tax=Histomonas meleagridis TaxID=135588 RepID=UPI0035595B96|nr:Clan IH, family I25, phytocystatin-like peptidase inhibitor [Histomonas meleagridis]KAH0798277.1 Clan IH, family I25, phytocystatin-like peptidase inhibitor [Histomonas meleagridis]
MSCPGCCCGGVSNANPNEEFIINVYKQAVALHNSTQNDNLEFVKIISVSQQVVSGFIFRGVIEAKKGDAVGQYEVDVWQKAGGREIEIQKFQAK